jgi:hypothetical protein
MGGHRSFSCIEPDYDRRMRLIRTAFKIWLGMPGNLFELAPR